MHPLDSLKTHIATRTLLRLLAAALLAALIAPPSPTSARAPLNPLPVHTAAPAASGLFINRTNKTNSAHLKIDGLGILHLAYSAYGPDANGKEPAYYATCAANCASIGSWTIATVTDGTSKVSSVQLALTPAGHPRMLLYGEDASFEHQWQYASCDANCTNGASWTVVTLRTLGFNDITIFDYSLHNFALDAQGRPRFIYTDTSFSNDGTWYAYCDTGCTNSANWFQVSLGSSSAYTGYAALAFSTSDQPRAFMTYMLNPGPTTGALSYLACDSACTNVANWTLLPLYERGGGHATWSLRLDASNRPRLAFYQGVPDGGGGDQLNYIWCNATCTSAANWGSATVGLVAGDGKDADLALDSQGRPRLAYQKSAAAGLGYGWCDTSCESVSGAWQHQLLEASTTLDADWPKGPPPNCTVALWYGGYRPSLALDASGRPRMGYDAEHGYDNCSVGSGGIDYKAVRFVLSSAAGGAFGLYLPAVRR